MRETADKDGRRYSIGELADATGVSRRTVHFYVQRRLIDPPLGRGRGQHYDGRHVQQILRVRELQRLGVPLADVPAAAATLAAAPAWPGTQYVVRLELNKNVTVELAAPAGPITPALAADLANAIDAVLRRHIPRDEEDQR